MVEKTLKAKVEIDEEEGNVELEFGATQCDMVFSLNGGVQRALKLKTGDKVEVTIKKL